MHSQSISGVDIQRLLFVRSFMNSSRTAFVYFSIYTQYDASWAMNERKRSDALKYCVYSYVNRTRGCRYLNSSKASRGRVGPLVLTFVRYLQKNFAPRFALRS